MRRLRVRLSTLMWLVATIAVFFGGVRYGEYRETARKRPTVRYTVMKSSPLHAGFGAGSHTDGILRWLCPHCCGAVEAWDDKAGQPMTCPKCEGRMTIPD